DDQHGEDQRQPAIGDDQAARRDVGLHADEEEGQHAGNERGRRGIANGGRPVETAPGGRRGRGAALLALDLGAYGLDVRRRRRGVACGHQTFSTSGLPSSPEGRKMSTMARIENAATSLYSTVK